ncbi:hypothetical protein GT360_20175 [Vibrio astriarenae]|uniref:Lipoprotein n=1 Tax=Vibrio astriarenae TaxID=1481923 RepID=A0A7Z2T7R8_9VIBR|nr:hypothetical protein [Vibrio astriarenae]QIA65832.1 hypothetical protein GT360_20175 [Vibrio astriarenae]
MRTVLTTALLSSFLISGCSHQVADNKGIAVDLYPVTYALDLSLEKSTELSVEREWNQFYRTHKQEMLLKSVELKYYSKQGKSVADRWQQELKRAGAADVALVNASGISREYDVSVEVHSYRVVTPVCEYDQVDQYGSQNLGCALESARWQSMVHPENVLIKAKGE